MRSAILWRFSASMLLGLATLAAFLAPPPAVAGDPLEKSLASSLLQSRAQLRIYRHDDQMDLECQSRAFTGAEVVARPRVVDEELDERKWLERWVLNRCGADVRYHVFFTEVGEGGAYFAFEAIE